MRASRVAAAAAAAASLPLWPAVAGAAEGPEQQARETHDVVIYGDTCHIDISFEYDADFSQAVARSYTTGEGNCRGVLSHISGYFTTTEGHQQVSASGSDQVSLYVSDVSGVDFINYGFDFTTMDCTSREAACHPSYTLQPK